MDRDFSLIQKMRTGNEAAVEVFVKSIIRQFCGIAVFIFITERMGRMRHRRRLSGFFELLKTIIIMGKQEIIFM